MCIGLVVCQGPADIIAIAFGGKCVGVGAPVGHNCGFQVLNKSVGVERLQVHGMFGPNEEFNFSSIYGVGNRYYALRGQ